jgi:glycosyltransferase involved in cell wall biosynthesis
MPTYNRANALRVTLPHLLDVMGVAEVVVVDDASADGTSAVLRETPDPRLRVIRHETRRGAPAARNTGIEAATGDWILFAEDDCLFPPDYALELRRAAQVAEADIVSAPWLNVPESQRERALAQRRAAPAARIGLDTHPSTFPGEPVRTPFLPALALVRRRVFDSVTFFDGFGGNAYREETDFFVSAARLGFVCVLTPATATFQAGQWPGGQRTSRLRYEYWVWRNNRLFLRRHGDWLREQEYIKSRASSELGFVLARLTSIAVGHARAVLGETR